MAQRDVDHTGLARAFDEKNVCRGRCVPTEIGEWGKHIQDTSSTKGKQLRDFTEIREEFVHDGRKEDLTVKLFRFLNENRASEKEMGGSLRGDLSLLAVHRRECRVQPLLQS